MFIVSSLYTGSLGQRQSKDITTVLCTSKRSKGFLKEPKLKTESDYQVERLSGKILPVNSGDSSSITESGRSSGEGHGNPFQYFCLENPMGRGVW